jgi:hypothetical protein
MPDREAQARKDRWTALTRYDPEIAPLAEILSVFGQKWVDEFENAFFALNEDTLRYSARATSLICYLYGCVKAE